MERILFTELPHYNTQNVRFSTKTYKGIQETGKYGQFTRKKEVDRNHPQRSPGIEFTEKTSNQL